MKTFGVSPEIIKQIEDKIIWCLETVHMATGKLLEVPTWEFRQSGQIAGYADCGQNFVSINPDFINNGQAEYIVDQTVPHEVAHLISVALYGLDMGGAHKYGWKAVMRMLGCPADRCHSLSMEGVKTKTRKRWEYKCVCCGKILYLTTNKHNKIQKPNCSSAFVHSQCGRNGTLQFTGSLKVL